MGPGGCSGILIKAENLKQEQRVEIAPSQSKMLCAPRKSDVNVTVVFNRMVGRVIKYN
jgi:hypothetical protein